MRKDGSFVTVELRATPVTWNGAPAVLASLRDVSDRIQARARIEHLNSVLRAMRNVNQLIVREKDSARLIQQTCDLLTETREELKKSEAQLRLAQQVAHIGHWELDAYDGTPVWSDEIFRIFGLEPGAVEPSFTKHDTIAYPEEWPLLDQAVRAGFENGTSFDLVFRILRPDHSPRWVHALGTARKDNRGRVVSMFGTAQDVTEYMLADSALRDTNELLSRFVLNSPIYAYLKEVNPTESRVLLASENYREMIGIPGSEMVGKRMSDLFPEELAAKMTHDDWAVVSRGEALVLEEELNGRLYTSIKFPVTLDERHLLAGYTIDITERKRNEDALRESRQLLEGILDSIPARVFWKDKDLIYLGCNSAFARDAGFASSQEVIGKDDYQMGWRDQADLYRSADREVIEHGVSMLLYEEPQTSPTGDTITLLTSKLPLRSATGEITGVLGTYMDITEVKHMQAQLAQSDRLSSMGMLAAGVAHEINNPLVLRSVQPGEPDRGSASSSRGHAPIPGASRQPHGSEGFWRTWLATQGRS